jgi:hypothetical protein
MLEGIDIDFYMPESPDELTRAKLFIKDTGNYIEFSPQKPYSVIEPMPILFANSILSEETYSLVGCTFQTSNLAYSRYSVGELFKGTIPKVFEPCFTEVEASITYLTKWLNHSRLYIKPLEQIKLDAPFLVRYELSKGVVMEIQEYFTGSFEKEAVTVTNSSSLTFRFDTAVSRMELYQHVDAFQKFLFLFVEDVPRLKSFILTNHEGKAIEQIIPAKFYNHVKGDGDVFTFDKLESYLAGAFTTFYNARNSYIEVLNLLLESWRTQTAEVSFLNLTTAFEVFHSYFLQNSATKDEKDILRNELLKEGFINDKRSGWTQILRYYHLLRQVKSIPYFDRTLSNHKKIIMHLRESRNYYTHFGESNDYVWTTFQLFFINRELRLLLKALLMRQLGFPDSLINTRMYSNAAYFSMDFENNPYSIHYKERSTDLSK